MSPNLRAQVERFIQTLKFECLNKFVIVAEKHLDHICQVGITTKSDRILPAITCPRISLPHRAKSAPFV